MSSTVRIQIRTLQPATGVIEEVDLIAEDRRSRTSDPALIDLLNEMDGIENDIDVGRYRRIRY